MGVLGVLLWLTIFIVGLFTLLLFFSLRVKIQVSWHEELKVRLIIGLGPLEFKEVKHNQKGNISLKGLRLFLQVDFLKLVLKTGQDIYQRITERHMTLQGSLGFSDPYYTGLLATCICLIPGLELEPDFSGPRRELELSVDGSIRLGILVYYLSKFLLAKETRKAWRDWRLQTREKDTNLGTIPGKWLGPSILK